MTTASTGGVNDVAAAAVALGQQDLPLYPVRVPVRLMRSALAACLVVLGSGSMGRFSPLLDLANIVRSAASLAAVALVLALLPAARSLAARALLGACLIVVVVDIWPTAPDRAHCSSTDRPLRIAWLNAHNPVQTDTITKWLHDEQPDIVGFAELGPDSHATRSAVAAAYPHRQSCLDNGRCSTVLFARRRPMSSQGLARGDSQNRETLSAARMSLAGFRENELTVVAVHLSRPLPLGRQRAEMRALEQAVRLNRNTIIIGDFNMPPAMRAFREFSARNGLRITPADRPTWPLAVRGRTLPPIWQIDHLLAGRNWSVADLRTSPDLGSDHRGFVAEVCRS